MTPVTAEPEGGTSLGQDDHRFEATDQPKGTPSGPRVTQGPARGQERPRYETDNESKGAAGCPRAAQGLERTHDAPAASHATVPPPIERTEAGAVPRSGAPEKLMWNAGAQQSRPAFGCKRTV